MGRARFIACALLMLCPLALTRHDDDFAFDNSEEFLVRSEGGRRIPSWLAVDSRHGLISGVPQKQDLGTHTFTVTAHGSTRGLTATDSFTVEVKKAHDKPHSKYGSCVGEESQLVLVIMVDGSFHSVAPRQRIRALMQLASFMALDGNEFWMEPYKAETHADTIMSGAGSSQRRHGDATTAIYLNVGCGNKLWNHHKVLVAGLREQARDGTLAHVLRLPVIGWRLQAIQPAPRIKRQLDGSGGGNFDAEYDADEDDADPDYSGYDENDDEDGYTNNDVGITDLHNEVGITALSASPSETTNVNMSVAPTLPNSPRRFDSFLPAIAEEPTTLEPELQTVIIRESNELPPMSSSTERENVTSPTPVPEKPTPAPPPTTTPTAPPTTPTMPAPAPTTAPTTTPTTPPTTTPTPETTLQEVTKQEANPTEGRSTIIGQTTETVTWAMPVNQPPSLKHHMKKLAITAGKAFRYIIPADLFTDPEEGSNLTFTMYEAENVPLSNNSWIQFIPAAREVYGLPLEAHVSRWNFIVEAQDSEGLVARGPLDITVQQHKSGRTINHQFTMEFKLLKEYNNAIDWQIRALEGIVNLFRDTDMDHLTVLNTTQNGDMCEFVWTNDTLPKDPACPMDDINRLMKIMESDTDAGSPSAGLARAMQPELKVGGVSWRGAGPCAHAPPATRAPDTYPPVTRNQVDHFTATVGHLLVYKVPEDTFFDPEDGGTRNLALSLRYSDRTELPAGHWLQFDAKNQEFYGLPAPSDEGSVSYQLIAEDSSKKSAYDSLIVEVAKAPTIRPTVEFQMTMEYPFPMLAYDANNKRKVVEKLAALFGKNETENIRIQSITNNPTTIIWYNTSLPMDRCPKEEIEELRKMIIVDERGSMGGALKENVDHVFDKDLKVMSIRLIPLGLCAEQNTKIPKTPIQVHSGSSNLQNNKASNAADPNYLVTFIIPAIVIVCMILLAVIIACVLHRRRRTGKMSVGDEEERQAFRSKGIPVIFQDELEERGEASPVHKSPVIMREEKPPLLPPAPDYRTADHAPYRPPPPFAPDRAPPRPKATPTYRKPPPYVPP